MQPPEKGWQAFIPGPVYDDADAPWGNDPAFAVILAHPGLRDSLGGHTAQALILAIELVRVLARVDLLEMVRVHRPAQGLCLGFGMNVLEPYDLLRVFTLDQVHAYEWIGTQVLEAAQTLQALQAEEPLLSTRIRLYHGTLRDLSTLANASIRVLYTANVFNWEIPMTPETFAGAIHEILRVLTVEGVVLSRGSAGRLEAHLAPHGRLLLSMPLITVFQKG
jgi:hypothetical protein